MYQQGAMFAKAGLGGPTNYCERCGRALSNPTSRQAGMGPICRHKVGRGSGQGQEEDIADRTIGSPLEAGIIIRRGADGVTETNVPHLVVEHSPSGYEFGYAGSGPADLALNLAEAILRREGYRGEEVKTWDGGRCLRLAYEIYQEVKWRWIATIERVEGVTLDYQEVADYVKMQATKVLAREVAQAQGLSL